jgi:asparagine synthase (glutamine-hydrolysing)
MCGIAGIVHFRNQIEVPGLVVSMTNAHAHRGPDAYGYYHDESVSLGHRRLSIIDLEKRSNQPFSDYTGRYVLSFNGEIYNYQSLKSSLHHYPFTTQSDTEVLIAAFSTWGIDCLHKLDGIFAFSLWDKETQTLWLVRDRFGVKPLYLFKKDRTIAFASEMRSFIKSGLLEPRLNSKGLEHYLAFHSVSSDSAILNDVTELEAGTYLKITTTSQEYTTYWTPLNSPLKTNLKRDEINIEVFKLLNKAVQKRMTSDVPLAAYLSGGIDSSAIVALMSLQSSQHVNTFTLGFSENEFDETEYATEIVKRFKTNHTSVVLDKDELLNKIVAGLDVMDSPSADGINTFLLADAITKANIKVALSGIGGDELFAGYPGFNYFLKLNKWKSVFNSTYFPRLVLSNLLKNTSQTNLDKFIDILQLKKLSISSVYPVLRRTFSNGEVDNLLKYSASTLGYNSNLNTIEHDLNKFGLLSQYSAAEYSGYAKNTILKDVDQMSMSFGLEVREPFFDHQLIEYVLSLPDEVKLGVSPKQLLSDALEPLLPQKIINRSKKGFVLPWEVWMKNEMRSFCESQIVECAEREFINKPYLINRWNQFLKNDKRVSWISMWQMVVLNYWMNKNGVEYQT